MLAPLPDGLGANPKIGVRAQAEIVQTKTELGLTLGQTKKLFERQGLALSRGGIQQILHRSAEVLEAEGPWPHREDWRRAFVRGVALLMRGDAASQAVAETRYA